MRFEKQQATNNPGQETAIMNDFFGSNPNLQTRAIYRTSRNSQPKTISVSHYLIITSRAAFFPE